MAAEWVWVVQWEQEWMRGQNKNLRAQDHNMMSLLRLSVLYKI
jgi:hypothetical protein